MVISVTAVSALVIGALAVREWSLPEYDVAAAPGGGHPPVSRLLTAIRTGLPGRS